ncbi:hypothetical protein QBC45DRAFT_93957 [Copromyces sp. CBS 386.78]|nr:hypothetical protein QBC45DRAFT_93957 [Copromyces sp. CBS 386.78]
MDLCRELRKKSENPNAQLLRPLVLASFLFLFAFFLGPKLPPTHTHTWGICCAWAGVGSHETPKYFAHGVGKFHLSLHLGKLTYVLPAACLQSVLVLAIEFHVIPKRCDSRLTREQTKRLLVRVGVDFPVPDSVIHHQFYASVSRLMRPAGNGRRRQVAQSGQKSFNRNPLKREW